jgi:hypothetical protein
MWTEGVQVVLTHPHIGWNCCEIVADGPSEIVDGPSEIEGIPGSKFRRTTLALEGDHEIRHI